MFLFPGVLCDVGGIFCMLYCCFDCVYLVGSAKVIVLVENAKDVYC